MRPVSRRNAVASAIPRLIPARQRHVVQPVWVVIHPVGIQHVEVPVEVPVKVRVKAHVRVPVQIVPQYFKDIAFIWVIVGIGQIGEIER
jgi:hypothetical protein